MLVASALAPGSAAAKEGIERLKVCGASGCRTITYRGEIAPLINGLGTNARPAPAPSEFFTLVPQPTRGWPDAWPRYVYSPEAQLVRQAWRRGHAEWYPPIWANGAYERATRGLKPFPEPVSWSALRTAARQEERNRLPAAVGLAVALVVVGGAGISVLRRRDRERPD